MVPFAADRLPARCHRAGAGEVVPGAARAQPAGLHNAGAVEVIVRSINHAPARGHRAGIVEPIPGAANLLPAGLHNAGARKVVPRAAQIQPARLHIARTIEVVVRAVDDAPFVRRIVAVVVGVPPTARSGRPVARKRDVIASTTHNVKACIHPSPAKATHSNNCRLRFSRSYIVVIGNVVVGSLFQFRVIPRYRGVRLKSLPRIFEGRALKIYSSSRQILMDPEEIRSSIRRLVPSGTAHIVRSRLQNTEMHRRGFICIRSFFNKIFARYRIDYRVAVLINEGEHQRLVRHYIHRNGTILRQSELIVIEVERAERIIEGTCNQTSQFDFGCNLRNRLLF